MKLHALSPAAASFIAAALVVSLAGCFPDKPAPPEAQSFTAEEAAAPLIEEWDSLPDDAPFPRRMEIANRLVLLGPEAFNPMFDKIADPDLEPMAKLRVLQAIMSFIQPAHFERLKALAESEDGTTRTMAAQLMGYTQHDQATMFLKTLQNDPEERVRFAALASRVLMGEREAHDAFMKLYSKEETPLLQKAEIIRIILTRWNPEETDILSDAVVQPWLSSGMRLQVALTFGQMGFSDAIEPLRKSIEIEEDPEYKQAVGDIVAALAEIEKDRSE